MGGLDELHREVNGFSASHSDTDVRIWAHYVFIKGGGFTFYRHPIALFNILPTTDSGQRWKAWTFVRNVYDSWVPDHFRKICFAIDMLPDDVSSEVSNQSEELQTLDEEPASSQSGLSQQLRGYSLADAQVIPDTQATQDTTN